MRTMLALALGVLALGCSDGGGQEKGPSKLTRDNAKEMLQNNIDFVNVNRSVSLRYANGGPVNVRQFRWDMEIDPGLEETKRLLSKFQQDGLLEYALERRESVLYKGGPAVSFEVYAISLTDKGKGYAGKESEGEDERVNVALKLCERHIAEISGIETPTPQSAIVHFSYKALNPTPFGKEAPKVCSGEVRKGKAEFGVFDDGWRVKGIEAGDPCFSSYLPCNQLIQ